jgi:hypothetical protein
LSIKLKTCFEQAEDVLKSLNAILLTKKRRHDILSHLDDCLMSFLLKPRA